MNLETDSVLVSPASMWMYTTIGALGVLNGILAGFLVLRVDVVLLNLHASVWMFLIVWAATTAYFSYRRLASGVIASGLYVLAWLVFLAPFAYFGPLLAESQSYALGERGQRLLEAFSGLFMWGLAGGVLALVLAGLAIYFRRRTNRLLSRKRKQAIRMTTDTGNDEESRQSGD